MNDFVKQRMADILAFEYATEHMHYMRTWGLKSFSNWMQYHTYHNQAAIFFDENDKINGLAVARRIGDGEYNETEDRYYSNSSGNVLFVDICIATTPQILKKLIQQIYEKIGECQKIAFRRFYKYDGSIRVYDFKKFLGILERRCYGRR